MSFNSSLNADVVKTALDGVFNQKFSGTRHPGHVTADAANVFKQDSADSSAVIMDLFKGSGAWEQRTEEQDVANGDPRIGNQKTFSIVNFSKSIDIPKIFFDDQKHGSYTKMVENFALRAKTSRDRNAFATYRNAFTTATAADGVALISDSHLNLNGDTVDNKLTAALTESSLNDAIVALAEMKSQDGEIDGYIPSTLLVPLKLFKKACEITKSELRSGTADNDMNVYSSMYGINIATSPYLGAAAGGSDTAWFLLSDEHSVMRFVRQPVQTALTSWEYTRNNTYIYKGEFREVVGAMSFEGIVGSDGTV
jgi:hypothetical protein